MKLNINGSSLKNPEPASADGVIRNNYGRLHTTYSVFLNQGSYNFVKMRNLLEGIRRCRQFNFDKVEIETDS